MAFVDQLYRFLRTGYGLMMRVENGDKLLDKFFSLLVYVFPKRVKLFVIYGKSVIFENEIQCKIFQQGIALTHYFLVLNELFQVLGIQLRNHAVHKFSAGFTAFHNQISVGRGDNNQGNKA